MTDMRFDIDRTFAIDRATMWSLWTDAAHAAKWMRPSLIEYGETTASVDARPGGSYRFEMHNGKDTYATSGTFVDVSPIDHLSFTWQWDGSDESTLVEVTLRDDGPGTRVTLVHTLFQDAGSADRHGEGWRGCFASIAALYEDAQQPV